MSSAKIEQDIQILEDKLAEVNTSISDPIERNESKKELQKKIKKLNKTKKNLEQLQKEQQELELLKHEVFTDLQRDGEQNISEQSKVVFSGDRSNVVENGCDISSNEWISEKNRSKKSKRDFSDRVEDNFETNVKDIEYSKKSLDVVPSTTLFYNSKKLSVFWIFCSVLGLLTLSKILIDANKIQTADTTQQSTYKFDDTQELLSTQQDPLIDTKQKRDWTNEELKK